ncbi:MAG: ABC transporter ATP-binding protein, partial [Clostridiales bacterium]|nr:ABC transporter ATP-binding protein [Clostridiales bacterium]
MSNQLIRGGRWSRNDMREDKRALPTARMSRWQIVKRLWRYLGRNRALLVLAALLTFTSSSLGLVGPRLSGLAIDAIGLGPGEANFPAVLYYVGLMAACYVLAAGFSYLLNRTTLRMTRNIIYRMRKDVFDKLVSLPVNFFDKYQAGEIISVVSYDIDTVNESLSTDFLQILQSVVTVSVSFVMMLLIKPALTLVFLVTIPLTALYTRWITGRTRPLFRKRSQKLGELNGYMEEMMGSKRPTRAYGREEQVIDGFDEKNEEAVVAYTTSEYYGTMIGPSVGFINNLSLTLISIFGALLYLKGQIGLGGISSFVQYSRRFSGPINELASILGELQSAFAAAERVFRLIDAEPEAPDAP